MIHSEISMQVSTTFTSTPLLIMRSYHACHRTAYLIVLPLALLLIVLGVVTQTSTLIGWGVGFPVLMEILAVLQLRRYLSGRRTVNVTITEDEYQTQGASGVRAWPWSVFDGVRRVGAFWVFRFSAFAAIALPSTG
jgi:hypothetical protein